MLSTASSAVPRLIPAPIIGRSFTCKILIYEEPIVNWTQGQVSKKPRVASARLGGGASRSCAGDGKNGRLSLSAYCDGRLEQLGKRLDASDQTRARAREVTVGFQRVHPAIANRGNGVPLFRKTHRPVFIASLFGAVPARRDQQDFWRGFPHMFGSDPERRSACTPEQIFAARALNHFRNPVAAHVERLQPFEKRDARALFRRVYLLFQNPEPNA